MTRTGNKVEVKMVAIRSRFIPDKIDVQAGDEVTIHVTNVEQTTDMIHGLGIIEHDMNVVVDPGRDQDREVHRREAGRLSLLLHQLLLGAPPGDAGLSRGEAIGPGVSQPTRRPCVTVMSCHERRLRPCIASWTAR